MGKGVFKVNKMDLASYFQVNLSSNKYQGQSPAMVSSLPALSESRTFSHCFIVDFAHVLVSREQI